MLEPRRVRNAMRVKEIVNGEPQSLLDAETSRLQRLEAMAGHVSRRTRHGSLRKGSRKGVSYCDAR